MEGEPDVKRRKLSSSQAQGQQGQGPSPASNTAAAPSASGQLPVKAEAVGSSPPSAEAARTDAAARASGSRERKPGKNDAKNSGKGKSGKDPGGAAQTSGAYTQREEHLQKLEAEGEVQFKYVYNDGSPLNMEWLIGLKNIFSKQLPNMPKEYISGLVLDRRHRSVAIVLKNGRTVIGGITYRAFHAQGLGEIAFCAISASEQVKGYGTRLMNYTKEAASSQDKLTHFLTYADNNAVGYFAKQGFTKEITLDTSRWVGYIKDYDGGTLMECVLHARICYTEFPEMISAQKAANDAAIRGLSNSHVVHAPLNYFRLSDGKRVSVPVAEIPGVREAGWTPESSGEVKYLVQCTGAPDPVPATRATLKKFMKDVITDLRVKQQAITWPFNVPVDAADVPDYYDVIKHPVDLETMEARLMTGHYYITLEMFWADLKRMCNNARIYNAQDTVFYRCANGVEAYIEKAWRSKVMVAPPTPPRPSE